MSRSLLGVLLVVVILGVAAALAVTGLSSTSVTVPEGALAPSTAPGGSVRAAAPSSVDRSALTAACNADAKSVDAAVQAYTAETGRPPADLAALTTASTVEGQTIGPFLRTVPGTAHYTIYVDSQGHVGVYAAHATPSGPVPAVDDFAQHPELCALVPS